MIRYEGDERALARVIAETSGVIDDAAARVIAAGYNDPGTATFVTTGAIPTGDDDDDEACDDNGPAEWLMDAIQHGVDSATLRRDATALNALYEYLVQRVSDGQTDAIQGWASLDIPRHVDYPHQNGALDTCWCYDETDED